MKKVKTLLAVILGFSFLLTSSSVYADANIPVMPGTKNNGTGEIAHLDEDCEAIVQYWSKGTTYTGGTVGNTGGTGQQQGGAAAQGGGGR
jgi:hypothetical protein